MNGIMALIKKELTEQWRTYRLIIASSIFLFFGLATPLMIKYLPELIKMAGESGMTVQFPPPTAIQAMSEYTGTMQQFGVLIAILMAMGAIARERERRTIAMVLTKPVSITAFILAKFGAMLFTFTAAVVLGGLACWGYTYILFSNVPALGFLWQSLLLMLYLALSISITVLFSSIFKSQLAAGALGLVTVIVLSLLSGLPWIGNYMPGELINWGTTLIAGQPASAAWGAVAVTLALTILGFFFACLSLKSQDL
jgi:ABC-2 type transport system permease protein